MIDRAREENPLSIEGQALLTRLSALVNELGRALMDGARFENLAALLHHAAVSFRPLIAKWIVRDIYPHSQNSNGVCRRPAAGLAQGQPELAGKREGLIAVAIVTFTLRYPRVSLGSATRFRLPCIAKS